MAKPQEFNRKEVEAWVSELDIGAFSVCCLTLSEDNPHFTKKNKNIIISFKSALNNFEHALIDKVGDEYRLQFIMLRSGEQKLLKNTVVKELRSEFGQYLWKERNNISFGDHAFTIKKENILKGIPNTILIHDFVRTDVENKLLVKELYAHEISLFHRSVDYFRTGKKHRIISVKMSKDRVEHYLINMTKKQYQIQFYMDFKYGETTDARFDYLISNFISMIQTATSLTFGRYAFTLAKEVDAIKDYQKQESNILSPHKHLGQKRQNDGDIKEVNNKIQKNSQYTNVGLFSQNLSNITADQHNASLNSTPNQTQVNQEDQASLFFNDQTDAIQQILLEPIKVDMENVDLDKFESDFKDKFEADFNASKAPSLTQTEDFSQDLKKLEEQLYFVDDEELIEGNPPSQNSPRL